jgi:ribosomal protein S1
LGAIGRHAAPILNKLRLARECDRTLRSGARVKGTPIITDIAPPHAEEELEDQLALEQRMYEESLKVLDEGQVLTGVIVAKYQDELLVDIGGKSEGFLSFRELSLAIEPKDLKVGDKLEVMIHRIDEEGTLFLSERRARALKTWEKVIAAHDNDEVIEATVTQVVKGGVLVDLGMRGFVPASQIRRQPVGNLEELVGKHLRLKVIDLDHKRHRVVLSQRLVLGVARRARGRTDPRRRSRAARGVRRVRRSRRHRRAHPQ